MILRLTITILLILLGTGALAAGKWWHRRLATGKTTGHDAPDRPTILYFRSDDCAGCLPQSRQLEVLQLETELPLAVQTVDVQRQPELADRFRVLTLPTTILLDAQGGVRAINYGLTPWSKLRFQLESV